ncbi:MAG: dihydroorotase [Gammaproteobacteria bacterium]|nr:dihydroorotase [Gammaproteobacteria bacterium]
MSLSSNIHIANGRLIDPANRIDQQIDLWISKGKILSLGEPPDNFKAGTTIDASGQIVCPGLVDLRAHLREPGQEYKATIASETAAAAKGGITTLCCPPDTDPIIDTPAMATLVKRRGKQRGGIRVLPVGALTQGLKGRQLSEMATLQQAGCVALSNGDYPLGSTLIERRALEYAATFGITTLMRPQDELLADGGCAHEGPVSDRLGLPGIPEAAETVAVARDLALAEQTGAKLHFHTLSTATAVRMVEQAQQQRLAVSADVAIHQLHLTEMDVDGFDGNCHLSPPLRSLNDRDCLRNGLARGTIRAICSDHQPHDRDAKLAPFPATAPGISGLETLLPLTLKLVQEGVLDLSAALSRITCGPADILGLTVGKLNIGEHADICIFDPEQHWRLSEDEMVSAGHNTPFLGWELQGQVNHTLFQGDIVYQRK